MHHGTISYWNNERAFGFIDNDAGGSRVFLHLSGFTAFVDAAQIHEGLKVEFEIVTTPDNRTKAANTKVIGIFPAAEVKRERLERNG